jgi:ATP-dependent RNA helicase RhlE
VREGEGRGQPGDGCDDEKEFMNETISSRAAVPDAIPPFLSQAHPGASFAILGLDEALVRALVVEGYELPTPVQRRAIPHVLDGRDVLGCAQTGTGKTAAFVLPMLQRLAARRSVAAVTRSGPSDRRGSSPRALVVAPTRELAAQIAERVTAYGQFLSPRIGHAVIYGGVGQGSQEHALRGRPEILVATPGRLLDLIGQGLVHLDAVEILVLDEADRMLDMGFLPDVKRIVQRTPRSRQTLLFSATIPTSIRSLASDFLRDPIEFAVARLTPATATVSQAVWHVGSAPGEKRTLVKRLLADAPERRAIVFTRTKRGANRVCEDLVAAGFIAGAIHGNKSQSARERVLDAFRKGTARVLVATDLAARGIDVDDVGLVVNYDLPEVAESYVHRIGRAGRAGNTGHAVSFCDPEERGLLTQIEKLLRARIPVAGSSVGAGATPEAIGAVGGSTGGGNSSHQSHSSGGTNSHPSARDARRPLTRNPSSRRRRSKCPARAS